MFKEDKIKSRPPILDELPQEQAGAIESLLQAKESKIAALEKENNWLKEQFKLHQQRLYGRSSETSQALQTQLIFDEAPIRSLPEEPTLETISFQREKIKKPGRKIDFSLLPCEQKIHDLMDDEKVCTCGAELEKIGEDSTKQLEHIPEQVKVIEHIRSKYCCRKCETIIMASKEEAPIPKCLASSSLLTDVIIKKYDHHLPLYRQSKILQTRHINIPANTLCNWVMQSAGALSLLGESAWQELDKVKILQSDDTKVKILEPNKEGYMWGYHSLDKDNRFVLFEFNLSRGSGVVNQRLNRFQGILQTDGLSSYNALRQKEGVINIGCWDHCRRKFSDVIKISNANKSGKAGTMLSLIGKLYQIEQDIKLMPYDERKKIRQQQAKPILAKIYEHLHVINAPPQSVLGKAVHYALNQWRYLTRYVEYGEAEISNCLMENQIRPFALGRRNWLFVGNEESANKSALLYSLIQTCKINNINPHKYLEYVLKQVHRMRRKEVEPRNLLPQFINTKLL